MPGASVKVGPVRVGSGCCVALVIPILFVVAITLIFSGCGSTKTTTIDQVETHTQTITVPHIVTRTIRATPTPAPIQDINSGSDIQSFSGNGGKNLGAITVNGESTLEWTNDGILFQIYTNENVPVNSQAHSGTSVLEAGKYSRFQVNAVGSWTIKIVPK